MPPQGDERPRGGVERPIGLDGKLHRPEQQFEQLPLDRPPAPVRPARSIATTRCESDRPTSGLRAGRRAASAAEAASSREAGPGLRMTSKSEAIAGELSRTVSPTASRGCSGNDASTAASAISSRIALPLNNVATLGHIGNIPRPQGKRGIQDSNDSWPCYHSGPKRFNSCSQRQAWRSTRTTDGSAFLRMGSRGRETRPANVRSGRSGRSTRYVHHRRHHYRFGLGDPRFPAPLASAGSVRAWLCNSGASASNACGRAGFDLGRQEAGIDFGR